MTFSRSTSVTAVLLSSESALSRYCAIACRVEAINDLLAKKLRPSTPSAAKAPSPIAAKPPNLVKLARRSATRSKDTQPDSGKITLVRRSCRKKLLPVPERYACGVLPKLRPIAPSTWSKGVPSWVPDEK